MFEIISCDTHLASYTYAHGPKSFFYWRIGHPNSPTFKQNFWLTGWSHWSIMVNDLINILIFERFVGLVSLARWEWTPRSPSYTGQHFHHSRGNSWCEITSVKMGASEGTKTHESAVEKLKVFNLWYIEGGSHQQMWIKMPIHLLIQVTMENKDLVSGSWNGPGGDCCRKGGSIPRFLYIVGQGTTWFPPIKYMTSDKWSFFSWSVC